MAAGRRAVAGNYGGREYEAAAHADHGCRFEHADGHRGRWADGVPRSGANLGSTTGYICDAAVPADTETHDREPPEQPGSGATPGRGLPGVRASEEARSECTGRSAHTRSRVGRAGHVRARADHLAGGVDGNFQSFESANVNAGLQRGHTGVGCAGGADDGTDERADGAATAEPESVRVGAAGGLPEPRQSTLPRGNLSGRPDAGAIDYGVVARQWECGDENYAGG